MSTRQVLTTVTVFDYLYDATGQPLANQEVIVQLAYSKANYIVPQVAVASVPIKVTSDSNGYWEAKLIANTNLTPANTAYTVKAAGQTYEIAVPAGAGPFQASAILTGAIAGLVGNFSARSGTVAGTLTVTGSASFGNAGVLISGGFLTAINKITVGSPGASLLPRSSQGMEFFAPGGLFATRVGTGFTTATKQWNEGILFGAGSDLGEWQMSFWDSALAPKHAWVMGLGANSRDALQWATASPQSVKMWLNYDDGSLYWLTRVSPVQAGAASLTPDAATYTFWRQTVNQNITINAPANAIQGQLLIVHLIHDNTATLYTFTWNAAFKHSGGANSSIANERRTNTYIFDGGFWQQVASEVVTV